MLTDDPDRTITYRICGREGQWRVESEGPPGMAYASKEAAFEAAVAAASNAIRDGYEVSIQVPAAGMLGAQDTGRSG